MGKAGGRDDFEWVYNDQPHTSRRKEILGKEIQEVSFLKVFINEFTAQYCRGKKNERWTFSFFLTTAG